MRHPKKTWFILVMLISLVASSAMAQIKPQASTVTLQRIGTPIWTPVDFHVFSAPAGSWEEFLEVINAIWGPPNHPLPTGAPHPPPYDTELAEGIARQGYHEGNTFLVTEFSGGRAIFLTFMLIPDPGTTGSSPDYTSGPIIPNTLFPISVDGTARRNGQLFDPDLDSTAPPVNEVAPRFKDTDGYSHLPFFFATSMDFAPPGVRAEGAYEYEMRIVDRAGNGWVARASFNVEAVSSQVLLPLVFTDGTPPPDPAPCVVVC
jgi:hypothetical protein